MNSTDESIKIDRDENGTHISVKHDAKITRGQFFELLASHKNLYKLQFFHDSKTIKVCDIVKLAPSIKILLNGNDFDHSPKGITASEVAVSEIEDLYFSWQGRYFPKWIFTLPKLKKLELSCSEMRILPKEIYAMTKLEELTLIWCTSMFYSIRLSELKKIKTLKWIHAVSYQMHHLQYMDIDDNLVFNIELPQR